MNDSQRKKLITQFIKAGLCKNQEEGESLIKDILKNSDKYIKFMRDRLESCF